MFTAVCRAYTDFVINLSTQEITDLGVPVGGGVRWEYQRMLDFIEEHKDKGQFIAGGPLPNSMAHVAQLGGEVTIIGKLADDQVGQVFSQDLADRGIYFDTPLAQEGGSPLTIVAVDETGERTIIYNRGTANDLELADIEIGKEILSKTKFLLSSLLVRQIGLDHYWERVKELIPADTTVVTTLQSMKDDEKAVKQIAMMLERADIIFGNEDEYRIFESRLEQTPLAEVARQCPDKLFVRTLGGDGAEAIRGEERVHVQPDPAEEKDATGAGDALAGGFIYAYSQGKSLEDCLKLGMQRARDILQITGGRPEL